MNIPLQVAPFHLLCTSFLYQMKICVRVRSVSNFSVFVSAIKFQPAVLFFRPFLGCFHCRNSSECGKQCPCVLTCFSLINALKSPSVPIISFCFFSRFFSISVFVEAFPICLDLNCIAPKNDSRSF